MQRAQAIDRKRDIAEAVLRLTARQGLEAASVRDVAAEAGVSVGLVQHYFRTKDEMLLFACQYMIERSGERARQWIAALPEPHSARTVLRGMLARMLPLDDERRIELRIWIAFLARAVVEPALEVFMRQTHQATHKAIAMQIRRGQRNGDVEGSIDPERATIALFMLVEGLVSHVQVGHYTGDQALQALDDHLATLFRPTAHTPHEV
ncbi:MAG TPA: TetR family transcriptional regulator C-terminal domain-containing protein [Roseiflexaceae bacterium]|nr:TetR family transcriptional regulator C-terminal domain-containing protein [Roseiflexaceae bacterium]